jgi:alginate O-acetyltransferase complex protein AlgI
LLFSSLVFIFGFLPVTLIGFAVLGRFGRRAGGAWLVAASLVFYGWWSPPGVLLLLTSIAANFAVARFIIANELRPRLQSAATIAGVAADLGALFYYKYLFSLLGFISHYLAFVPSVSPVVLPLGISFFTFTQIAYLVDCRAGIAKDGDVLNYVLFVTFFPHLIAGPIVHNRDIMPQFAQPRTYRLTAENLSVGLSIFVIGLVKKDILADPLSSWVTEGYGHTAGIGWLASWHLALCYSLQLYFDFSGYSDMAIGLARMLNITFPRNFESPYKAQNVIEYWQRWHITLTQFLTSYLYTPLALSMMRRRLRQGRRVNRSAQQTVGGFATMLAAPLLITMGLAGIWHGSGPTFLIFGLLHGVYLCVNHLVRVYRPSERRGGTTRVIARVLLTYLAVLVASVFFRAPSVTAALDVLSGMTGLHGLWPQVPLAFGVIHCLQLGILYAIVWCAPNTQQIMRRFRPVLGDVPAPARSWTARFLPVWISPVWLMRWPSALAIGALAAAGVLALGGTTEFLYFQF